MGPKGMNFHLEKLEKINASLGLIRLGESQSVGMPTGFFLLFSVFFLELFREQCSREATIFFLTEVLPLSLSFTRGMCEPRNREKSSCFLFTRLKMAVKSVQKKKATVARVLESG